MQILARPKKTTSKTAFILYINVLEHWSRIKNGLVLKVDFEHPTCRGKSIIILALLPLQGVCFPLHFTTGRCPGLVAFAPSGRYLVIVETHLFEYWDLFINQIGDSTMWFYILAFQ